VCYEAALLSVEFVYCQRRSHTVRPTNLFRVSSLDNPHKVGASVLSKPRQFARETAITLTTVITPNEHLRLISISELIRELQPNEYAK